MSEAIDWKAAVEKQVGKLEDTRKPMLPPSSNPVALSSIIGMTLTGGHDGWKCIRILEGMRILSQINPGDNMMCMKAQIVVKSTPVTTFLSIMDGNHFWPEDGSFKVGNSILK